MDYFQMQSPFGPQAIEAVQRMVTQGLMPMPAQPDQGIHPITQLAGASNQHKLRTLAHAKLVAQALQHLRQLRQA